MRRARSHELTNDEQRSLRQLLDDAFAADGDEFTEGDWQHALDGLHFLLEVDGQIVAHGPVVERELRTAGLSLRTGYVVVREDHHGLRAKEVRVPHCK